MTIDLPYNYEIRSSSFGAVEISGIPKENARRFEVNLINGEDKEINLHFQARFDENCVVRNSTSNGNQWQAEERAGHLPFAQGRPFKLELINDNTGRILCLVDGMHFTEFFARSTDPNLVQNISVDGDLFLESIIEVPVARPKEPPLSAHEDNEPVIIEPQVPSEPEPKPSGNAIPEKPVPIPSQPTPGVFPSPDSTHDDAGGETGVAQPQHTLPVPYHAQLDKFLQTNRMRIVGKPLNNPQRFTVNLISANGEVLFHFNPRFEQNCVARNYTTGRQYAYDHEQRSSPCPFAPGRTFALDYIASNEGFIRCFVDGAEYCQFQIANGTLSDVRLLEISGDIQLEQVLIV